MKEYHVRLTDEQVDALRRIMEDHPWITSLSGAMRYAVDHLSQTCRRSSARRTKRRVLKVRSRRGDIHDDKTEVAE